MDREVAYPVVTRGFSLPKLVSVKAMHMALTAFAIIVTVIVVKLNCNVHISSFG
jgi:hypothetical protein